MKQYLELLETIMAKGHDRINRTAIKSRSIFGGMMRFNLAEGFPLVTTKKVFFKGIKYELLWFLRNEDKIDFLLANDVHIWDKWANDQKSVGYMYGCQWLNWNNKHINQLDNIIDLINNKPYSRRMIISSWNPELIPQDDGDPRANPDKGFMALAPCHPFAQFYVRDGYLSCAYYQRSVDVFLGLPFNIASYALLTHLISQQTNLKPGELIFYGGDIHIYHNHFEQIKIQLQRKPLALPEIQIIKRPNIYSYQGSDIKLKNYQCYPEIKGEIAV